MHFANAPVLRNSVAALQLEALWRGYEGLEMSGSNKQLARRLLDEWRPKYQAGACMW